MHMQIICIIEYLSMIMIRIQNKFAGKVRSSLLILWYGNLWIQLRFNTPPKFRTIGSFKVFKDS